MTGIIACCCDYLRVIHKLTQQVARLDVPCAVISGARTARLAVWGDAAGVSDRRTLTDAKHARLENKESMRDILLVVRRKATT